MSPEAPDSGDSGRKKGSPFHYNNSSENYTSINENINEGNDIHIMPSDDSSYPVSELSSKVEKLLRIAREEIKEFSELEESLGKLQHLGELAQPSEESQGLLRGRGPDIEVAEMGSKIRGLRSLLNQLRQEGPPDLGYPEVDVKEAVELAHSFAREEGAAGPASYWRERQDKEKLVRDLEPRQVDDLAYLALPWAEPASAELSLGNLVKFYDRLAKLYRYRFFYIVAVGPPLGVNRDDPPAPVPGRLAKPLYAGVFLTTPSRLISRALRVGFTSVVNTSQTPLSVFLSTRSVPMLTGIGVHRRNLLTLGLADMVTRSLFMANVFDIMYRPAGIPTRIKANILTADILSPDPLAAAAALPYAMGFLQAVHRALGPPRLLDVDRVETAPLVCRFFTCVDPDPRLPTLRVDLQKPRYGTMLRMPPKTKTLEVNDIDAFTALAIASIARPRLAKLLSAGRHRSFRAKSFFDQVLRELQRALDYARLATDAPLCIEKKGKEQGGEGKN